MTDKLSFPDRIYNDRLERLQSRKTYSKEYEKRLIDKITYSLNEDQKLEIQNTIHFGKNLKYSHPGLDSNQYFLHPLRVATLVTDYIVNFNINDIICALLHNVLEVSDISNSELESKIGIGNANTIKILTVDRNLQDDKSYKINYYDTIRQNETSSKIKALDKFDNIFLLCLNPYPEKRQKYLEEIHREIVPLVKLNMPILFDYFMAVVDDCESLGYLSSKKSYEIFREDFSSEK